jgi:TolB protein
MNAEEAKLPRGRLDGYSRRPSRRRFLRQGTIAYLLAAGLPMISACMSSSPPAAGPAAGPPAAPVRVPAASPRADEDDDDDDDHDEEPSGRQVAPRRADGAELLYLPPADASAQNPAYAPDGSTLLFTLFHRGYNRGPAGLYALAFGQAEPVRLLDEPNADSVNLPGTCWNARTSRIAFASDRADHVPEIWTMAPDGTALTRVTDHAANARGEAYLEPSFSRAGDWLVFEIDSAGSEDRQQGAITIVRADGTGLQRLTPGRGGATDDRVPNWSPTDERILFQRRQRGQDAWNLYTMTPDGGNLVQVTNSPFGNTDPSWSPDGRWVVYSTDHGGLHRPNIFVAPAEGGEPIRVTQSEDREDGAPSWSPDGRWIAFESHLRGGERSPSAIWRIAAPAGAAR